MLKSCKSLDINLALSPLQDKSLDNQYFKAFKLKADEDSLSKNPFNFQDSKLSPKSMPEVSCRSFTKVIEDSIPVSSNYINRKRKQEVCTACKPKLPCQQCSKSALLDLAKRIPLSSYSQRHATPMRAYSNSLFVSPIKSEKSRTMTSLLTKKLSEAAKKMDRKTYLKRNINDKEPCKVM